MTTPPRPTEQARILWRAGTRNIRELHERTGVPLDLLLALAGQWQREMARAGRAPKRGRR